MQKMPIITSRFRRQVGFCGLVLLCENMVLSFWKLVAFLCFICSLLLLNFLPNLDFWLHAGLLLVIGIGLAYFLVGAIRKFRWPSHQAIFKRLEENNDLPHQPLQNLNDTLSQGEDDALTRLMWEMHRSKMVKVIASVRNHGPKPVLANADPFALRLLAGLILIVSLIVAGEDGNDRILASLSPDISGPVNYKDIKISAWITPPAYTNMAPVFLSSSPSPDSDISPPLVEAPVGSMLVIQLSNLTSQPMVDNGSGDPVNFDKAGSNSYSYQQKITTEDMLLVSVRKKTIAGWRLFVRPDIPPQISFVGDPQETNRKALQVSYKAYDDYGVEEIALRLRRSPVLEGSQNNDIYEYPVILSASNRDFIEADYLRDLTSHPWAGTQILLELVAKDAIGNETVSPAKSMIMPQRVFNHPVALELVKLRTKLALNPVLARHKVALSLGELGGEPASYNYDVTVHLVLRAAALRLIYPTGESEVDEVINLLWQLALRIEDGGLSLAETRLRAAQNAIMEALAQGASVEELSRLMDELEQAMSEYLQELAENMQRNDSPETLESGVELTPAQLQSMMDRVRELMQMGMKDAAHRMLSDLQKMMENIQAGMPKQSTPQGMEALEMMQGLKDIMQGQRELLEKSYKQMQNPQDNMPSGELQESSGGGSGEQSNNDMNSHDAMIQKKLRQELGDLMKRYEDLMQNRPPAFSHADRAMGRAQDALSKGNIPRAVNAEGQALDQLQSATRAMQEQLMERFSGEGALGQQLLGESGEGGRDPFGREGGTDSKNSPEARGMKIPAESDFQRVRSIRDELRRRSGDLRRPPEEIDYIDRLLQPF